ncbi:hypothetical protein U9R62_10245 [Cylindrospermopsis raciborskii DSH]|uniref:hypothetical protein n=1 Tax=Cylindrospermopsis raciborskii TaxID=77022 RepID=UPI002ED7D0AF
MTSGTGENSIKIDGWWVLKTDKELDLRILDILHENAEHLMYCMSTDIPGKLGTLIRGYHGKICGQRAVL